MTDFGKKLMHLVNQTLGVTQEIRGSSQRAEKSLTNLLPLLDLLEPEKSSGLGDRLVEAMTSMEEELRLTREARATERQQFQDLAAEVRRQTEELAKLRRLFQSPLD